MFTSSLDADTDGVEGLTYVWTPAQLREVLGDDDGDWAATTFAVTSDGNVRARDVGAAAARRPRPTPTGSSASRSRLARARAQRPQPGRDDKVVTAWNGLAITALAEARVALGEPELLDAATTCARAVVDLHVVDGRLRRASLGGVVGDSAAILEDHAALATGC